MESFLPEWLSASLLSLAVSFSSLTGITNAQGISPSPTPDPSCTASIEISANNRRAISSGLRFDPEIWADLDGQNLNLAVVTLSFNPDQVELDPNIAQSYVIQPTPPAEPITINYVQANNYTTDAKLDQYLSFAAQFPNGKLTLIANCPQDPNSSPDQPYSCLTQVSGEERNGRLQVNLGRIPLRLKQGLPDNQTISLSIEHTGCRSPDSQSLVVADASDYQDILGSTNQAISYQVLNGDLDGDGTVGILDISRVINYFDVLQCDESGNNPGDADGDCDVDISDIALIVNNFDHSI